MEKIVYHQLNINLSEIKNEESWIIDGVKGDDFWRIENFQRNHIKTVCKKDMWNCTGTCFGSDRTFTGFDFDISERIFSIPDRR